MTTGLFSSRSSDDQGATKKAGNLPAIFLRVALLKVALPSPCARAERLHPGREVIWGYFFFDFLAFFAFFAFFAFLAIVSSQGLMD